MAAILREYCCQTPLQLWKNIVSKLVGRELVHQFEDHVADNDWVALARVFLWCPCKRLEIVLPRDAGDAGAGPSNQAPVRGDRASAEPDQGAILSVDSSEELYVEGRDRGLVRASLDGRVASYTDAAVDKLRKLRGLSPCVGVQNLAIHVTPSVQHHRGPRSTATGWGTAAVLAAAAATTSTNTNTTAAIPTAIPFSSGAGPSRASHIPQSSEESIASGTEAARDAPAASALPRVASGARGQPSREGGASVAAPAGSVRSTGWGNPPNGGPVQATGWGTPPNNPVQATGWGIVPANPTRRGALSDDAIQPTGRGSLPNNPSQPTGWGSPPTRPTGWGTSPHADIQPTGWGSPASHRIQPTGWGIQPHDPIHPTDGWDDAAEPLIPATGWGVLPGSSSGRQGSRAGLGALADEEPRARSLDPRTGNQDLGLLHGEGEAEAPIRPTGWDVPIEPSGWTVIEDPGQVLPGMGALRDSFAAAMAVAQRAEDGRVSSSGRTPAASARIFNRADGDGGGVRGEASVDGNRAHAYAGGASSSAVRAVNDVGVTGCLGTAAANAGAAGPSSSSADAAAHRAAADDDCDSANWRTQAMATVTKEAAASSTPGSTLMSGRAVTLEAASCGHQAGQGENVRVNVRRQGVPSHSLPGIHSDLVSVTSQGNHISDHVVSHVGDHLANVGHASVDGARRGVGGGDGGSGADDRRRVGEGMFALASQILRQGASVNTAEEGTRPMSTDAGGSMSESVARRGLPCQATTGHAATGHATTQAALGQPGIRAACGGGGSTGDRASTGDAFAGALHVGAGSAVDVDGAQLHTDPMPVLHRGRGSGAVDVASLVGGDAGSPVGVSGAAAVRSGGEAAPRNAGMERVTDGVVMEQDDRGTGDSVSGSVNPAHPGNGGEVLTGAMGGVHPGNMGVGVVAAPAPAVRLEQEAAAFSSMSASLIHVDSIPAASNGEGAAPPASDGTASAAHTSGPPPPAPELPALVRGTTCGAIVGAVCGCNTDSVMHLRGVLLELPHGFAEMVAATNPSSGQPPPWGPLVCPWCPAPAAFVRLQSADTPRFVNSWEEDFNDDVALLCTRGSYNCP
eukprot:jgi/Mesvir1/8691/Mv02629-RA.1